MDEKIDFLKNEFIPLLRSIPSDTPPLWGKMTVQQMIEHFSLVFRVASGKRANTTLITSADKLPGMQQFLMSDKPFPQNIENPLLPKDPIPVWNSSMADALDELQSETDFFFSVFEENNQLTTLHPYFGPLNYEMNVQALYKHALHHLKQFGVEPVQLNHISPN